MAQPGDWGIVEGETPRVQVCVRSGTRTREEFVFSKSPITFGRLVGNDVSFPGDTAVSGHHAKLLEENGLWVLEDLDSRNGTFIEFEGVRQRVEGRSPIAPGQAFMLGRTILAFEVADVPAAGTSPAPQDAGHPFQEGNSETGDRPVSLRSLASVPGFPGATGDAAEGPSVVLRVDVQGDRLRFELPSSKAHATRYTIPYRPDEVDQIQAELRRVIAFAHHNAGSAGGERGRDQVLDRLRQVGSHVFEHLLPKRVQEKLAEVEAANLFLLHSPELLHVPWELAVLDGEFLSLRFNLGRQVIVEDFSARFVETPNLERPRMLLIADPTEDLPDLQAHAEGLFRSIQADKPTADVTFLAGGCVERLDVLTRLEDSDIVYFVGHAEHDGRVPENSGWVVKDGRITCADFARLRRRPAVVFANGCNTSKEAAWSQGGDYQGQAFGLASSFILAGVENYLGAAWPISADGSLTFAREFFERLLSGHTVGECVREGRQAVIGEHGYDELAWAAFTLYGDPGRRAA